MNNDPRSIQITPILGGSERPSERVGSVEDAFSKFQAFAQQHEAALAELASSWSEAEQAMRVGFSVEFESTVSTGSVLIHAANEGGVALCRLEGRLRITKGAFRSNEVVAFLHPEWTEFEVSELNTYAFLLNAMKNWAESGSIPIEYLR